MKSKLAFLAVVALSCTLAFWWLWSQNQAAKNYYQLQPGEKRILSSSPSPEIVPVDYQLETVVENLDIPWSIVFTSPERILVTERPGTIRVVENNTLQEAPLLEITDVSHQSEAGLMGMVLDPNYNRNKRLYVCYAYESDQGMRDKVVAIQDQGDSAEIVATLIDTIPAARFHAGCRLKIGPDQKLYITTGDATQKEKAQDLEFLGGKILRLNLDGSIPADNPFPGSPVYSLGHRNPQGLTWHPVTNQLFATEHGPSGNDGPPGGDEVNQIMAGGNYGWPLVSHDQSLPELIDPLITFTPAEAPGSALIYSGKVFPQFTNRLFFGALGGEGLVKLDLSLVSPHRVESYEKLDIQVGRVRDVVEGPDGYIYFTTSNRDGRGQVNQGDDKIYRLVPEDQK